MKVAVVNLRCALSVLVAIATRFDFTNCIPVGEPDKLSDQLAASTWLSSSSQTSAAPPPLVFPSGNTGVYKIVENDTALKILQARTAAELAEASSNDETTTEGQNVQQQSQQPLSAAGNGVSDGELNAVNGNSTGSQSSNFSSTPSSNSNDDDDGDDDDDGEYDDDDYYSTEADDKDDEQNDEYGTIDTETVDVQPEDPEKEDGLEEQFGRNKDDHFPMVIDNTMIEVSIRQEHLWVIVAGAIFVLTLAAYIAMVVYRNRLERRYGMRQRLVTEDDFYTNNDI
ncbi:trigger factor [Topomyia yanbarensis]|uniref:trigger factor n=1 Tax=Topomyia yanbarensis TaxID=2498891 RepID=UPI00273B427F|nr:trigger factor [Topomyia yanbarensis]